MTKFPNKIISADWTLPEIADAHNKLNKDYFENDEADNYEAFFKLKEAFEWIESQSKNKSILDVGCGAGWHAVYLREKGFIPKLSYTGIDISHSMCDAARKNFPAGKFHVADICKAPVKEKYDIVMESAVLELVHNWKRAFNNMLSCSKKWFISHRLFIKDGRTHAEQVKTYNGIPDIRFHIGREDLGKILDRASFEIAKEDIWHTKTYTMGTIIYRRKND